MNIEKMNGVRKILRATVIAVFALLFFANCSDYVDSLSQNVEYDLRGTWERTETAFWPEGQTATSARGKVVLSYNTITITGPVARLKNFTRNTTLEAYTEGNKLYIKDKGAWQSPVSYNKWEAGGSYPRDKMLTLEGGGVTDESLKRTN